MKITIESTSKVVELKPPGTPVQARIWEGDFEGTTVHLYVTRIAVPKDAPPAVLEAFERALLEQRAPSPEVAAIPARMIL
jgi:hypothetical protein